METIFRGILRPKHVGCLSAFMFYVTIIGSYMHLAFAFLMQVINTVTYPIACTDSTIDGYPSHYVTPKCSNHPLLYVDNPLDEKSKQHPFDYHM